MILEKEFNKFLEDMEEDPELMYSGDLNLLRECWHRAIKEVKRILIKSANEFKL